MTLHSRVHTALEAPVLAAEKILDELPEDDSHERLAIQLDGWGRGIADALEEIARARAAVRARVARLRAS